MLVFAKWVYETYRKMYACINEIFTIVIMLFAFIRPHTLHCLMGYIIHLTNVMQGIFQ